MTRMLLISPDLEGISWSTESELVSGDIVVVPLLGRVTHERITRATQNALFDILHVASHGSQAGIVLSEGQVLSKEQMAQIAKQVNANLVYLNACSSALMGQYLADRGVPLVVCYTLDVFDSDALRTATYFYQNAARLQWNYVAAVEQTSKKDGTLATFSGVGYANQLIEPVLREFRTVSNELRALVGSVRGYQRLVVRVLVSAVAVALFGVLGMTAWWQSARADESQPVSPLNEGLTRAATVHTRITPTDAATDTPVSTNTPIPTETPQPTTTATPGIEPTSDEETATSTSEPVATASATGAVETVVVETATETVTMSAPETEPVAPSSTATLE